MKNCILFIVIAFILTSCSKKQRRPECITVSADKTIMQFSDSSFFSNIACLNEYEGDIYLSDKKRFQIFRLDSNLNLLKTIGMQGHGPQDFGYIEKFVIHRDTIFVGDVTKKRILRFSTGGQFCGAENPDEIIPLNYRYCADSNKIYYFSDIHISQGQSLVAYNRTRRGEMHLTPFGLVKDFKIPEKNYNQNRREVHLYNNTLIVIPVSIPVVEIYDATSLKLIQTVDISSIPVVKDTYSRLSNDRTITEAIDKAYFIFSDSYINRNKLYILPFIYKNNQLDHSSLLEFDLSNGGAEWVRQYDFPDFVQRFCITDDYIYGFVPQNSSIKRYPLPA